MALLYTPTWNLGTTLPVFACLHVLPLVYHYLCDVLNVMLRFEEIPDLNAVVGGETDVYNWPTYIAGWRHMEDFRPGNCNNKEFTIETGGTTVIFKFVLYRRIP